jgi:hypothetical protein
MAAWNELEKKWGDVDICGAGHFNIDAKLNGPGIVMGLLYGDGDPLKTLEISTRCGQDSDCNPSNALACMGVISGFSNLPLDMKTESLPLEILPYQHQLHVQQGGGVRMSCLLNSLKRQAVRREKRK